MEAYNLTSVVYSLTESLIDSLTDSLADSLADSLTDSLICPQNALVSHLTLVPGFRACLFIQLTPYLILAIKDKFARRQVLININKNYSNN